MQKSEVIKNHKIKPEESGHYHVLFTRIVKEGKRTRDVHNVQLYSKREFVPFMKYTSVYGLGVTGYDEMEIIHDPTKSKVSSEADDIRSYLTEKDVKFHPKMGLEKLQLLKKETEDKLN